MSKIIKVLRKNYPVYVKKVKVKDLDKTKCSAKFLRNELPKDYEVYVKCLSDGTLDLRGKHNQYRILPINKVEQIKDK